MDLINIIYEHSAALAFYGIIASAIAFIISLSCIVKTSLLHRKYKNLMQGVDGKNLEQMLEHQLSSIKNANSRLEKIDGHLTSLNLQADKCIQGVGIVRYNPFDEMGSDQSFSVALIDSEFTGVILTGIFSRQTSTTYAKPLTTGKSSYKLSEEEQEALEKAKDSLPGKIKNS